LSRGSNDEEDKDRCRGGHKTSDPRRRQGSNAANPTEWFSDRADADYGGAQHPDITVEPGTNQRRSRRARCVHTLDGHRNVTARRTLRAREAWPDSRTLGRLVQGTDIATDRATRLPQGFTGRHTPSRKRQQRMTRQSGFFPPRIWVTFRTCFREAVGSRCPPTCSSSPPPPFRKRSGPTPRNSEAVDWFLVQRLPCRLERPFDRASGGTQYTT
jgi:hypothetical protein